MSERVKELSVIAASIRLLAVKSLNNLGFGHIGGIMSMTELLAVLYWEIMSIDPKKPDWEDRDRFVLSKGHSGPGLLATLALRGYFPIEEMETLNQGATRLPSHCDMNKTPGIDMTTGSLGQGMSTAIGIAVGNRLKGKSSYTYLLLGDGECNEGQVWEGAMFAPQHKLDHLIAFIDNNKKQLDGYTKDICDLGDLRQKFNDFNWYTQEIDGHDINSIIGAINIAKKQTSRPSMIVLNTVKGKGCSFAENELFNHHMKFSKEQGEEAIQLIEGCIKELERKVV